ncbi:MAG: LuxR C-terminal-related transcriptional regulator, partial [Acidimicrobiales bacterium]
RSEVERWGEAGPKLVALDDLHWADPDSLELIGFLARRLAGLRVVIFGALRPWPARAASLARSLAHEGHARIVEVHPLSEASSTELLHQLVGQGSGAPAGIVGPDPMASRVRDNPPPAPELAPEVARRAWRLTKGNPMLVEQAARTVAETGDLPESAGADLSRMQRTLLLSHLAGLSGDALECARAASVLGTRIQLGALESVTGIGEEAFVEAFDSLIGAGVLREGSAGCAEFSHDLLASAIHEDTPPARRRALHLRAFAYCAARGDPSSAAPHVLAADMAGDDRAVTVLIEAGTAAVAEGAIHVGLAHLRAGVALAGPGAGPEQLGRLGDALFAADYPDEALALYQRLLARPLDPSIRIEVLTKAARAQAFAGEVDRAMHAYGEALDELASLGPDTAAWASLASLLGERAHVAWEASGPLAALAMLDRASASVWPDPEPAAIGALRSYMRLNLGDPSGLTDIAKAATAARTSADTNFAEATRSLNLFLLHPGSLAFVERFEEAYQLIEYARHRYSSAGSTRSAVALATVRASILLNQGALDDVVAAAERMDDGADMLGRPRLALMRAEALTALGRVEESVALCDAVEAMGIRSLFAGFNLGLARAQHLAARGLPLEAAERYLNLEELARVVGVASMATARWAAGAIEAALAARRTLDVARIAAWLDQANSELACTWPTMLSLGARAGLAGAEGDEAAAAILYPEALGACTVMPLVRAEILARYGTWLRGRGRVTQARRVLAECLEVAERHGASLLASATRAELSAAGGRRRRAPRAGGLTTQEARVAQLAAARATTREIAATMHLSPRTVDTHLAHAYAKLGVHSRRELRQHPAALNP